MTQNLQPTKRTKSFLYLLREVDKDDRLHYGLSSKTTTITKVNAAPSIRWARRRTAVKT